MDENKFNDETVDIPAETAETVNEAEETVDETVETVNEIGETANADGTGAEYEPAVSKKTTWVLVGIIIVLVAVIAVFAALFVKKYLEDKKNAANIPVVTEDVNVLSNTSSGNAQSTSEDIYVTPEVINYNVTVELGQYVGIEADLLPEEVTDEQVQDEIDITLMDYAEEINVTDRPVQNGDVANIDYTGYMDDVAFEGGADTGYDLEIGSGVFIPGFEEGLIGHSVGETVDVEVTFPEDYDAADLAGREALFVVVINAIKEYNVPELTDEFVKENLGFDTADAFRASIRADLEEFAAEDAEVKAQADIFDKLIADSVFGGDIDAEIEAYATDYIQYNDSMAQNYYGVDGATLYSYIYGISADEYEQMIYEQSEYSVKHGHIMDKIAEVEKFEISEEEYEAAFEELFFDYYGFASKDEVLQALTQDQIDEMIDSVVYREKAENFVIENAVIKR